MCNQIKKWFHKKANILFNIANPTYFCTKITNFYVSLGPDMAIFSKIQVLSNYGNFFKLKIYEENMRKLWEKNEEMMWKLRVHYEIIMRKL